MAVIHEGVGERRLLTYASIRKFFPPVTTTILLIQIGLYIAGSVSEGAKGAIDDWLGASARGVEGGRVWQFFTYALVGRSGGSLLFNGAALISFASRLERTWGRRWYILYCLLISAATVLPLLILPPDVVQPLGVPIVGDFVLTLAAIAAFGWVYRRQEALLFGYHIPVPTYVIAVLLILALLMMQLPIALLWFLAALWGWCYARFMERHEKNRAYQIPKPRKDAGRFKGLDLD